MHDASLRYGYQNGICQWIKLPASPIRNPIASRVTAQYHPNRTGPRLKNAFPPRPNHVPYLPPQAARPVGTAVVISVSRTVAPVHSNSAIWTNAESPCFCSRMFIPTDRSVSAGSITINRLLRSQCFFFSSRATRRTRNGVVSPCKSNPRPAAISCAHNQRMSDDFPVPVFPRSARCSFRLVDERTTCFRLTSPSATIQPRSNCSRHERRFRDVSRFHRSFAMCLSNESLFQLTRISFDRKHLDLYPICLN